ncbi:MAG: cache domain-containing protein, partial [Mariprofundus sp.]|nr:cache domain-containing protein [Mariprofundus sp.]
MMVNKASLPGVKHSIFGEFMLLLIVVAIPFLLAIGWYVLSSFEQFSTEQQLQSLTTLAEEKASTINRYIDDHADRVETLAMMPVMQAALPAFATAFQQGVDSTAYHQANRSYGAFFERYLAHWNYYDLFLIDAQGNIVYSIKHEADFATNLNSGAYRDTGLAQVFNESRHFLQSNNSTFAYYAPSDAVAAFVAMPVVADGKMIGVIALQFDTDAFYAVINNLIGLGQTGEVVVGQVVDGQILLTAPLRHDRELAFKRVIALD